MSKVFKLSKRGLSALMKSEPMRAVLNDAADKIAAAAGKGFEVEHAHPIRFVAIAAVHTSSYRARLRESTDKVLEKAAGSVKI